MATLSFLHGKRLAVIKNKGGPYDGETVFLYDPDHKCCTVCSEKCRQSPCCSKCSLRSYHTKISKDLLTPEIQAMLMKGMKDGFEIMDFEEEEEKMKSIVLNGGGKFQQSPSNMPFTMPDLNYISGRRGSGKSFSVALYLEQFTKCYPNYKIYLFSAKDKDELLEKYRIKRIDITKVKEAQFVSSDFQKSLVIFDDVDSLPNNKDNDLKTPVYDIMTDIIETGRSYGVFCIVTSHLPANSGESRRILNGATSFTFYLASSNHGTEYVLKNYFGFSTKQIQKIIQMEDTRWVTVFRDCPQMIMTENKIMFQSEIMNIL